MSLSPDAPTGSASRPARPLLVYDANCKLSRRLLDRWDPQLAAGPIDIEPLHLATQIVPQVGRLPLDELFLLVEPNGEFVYGGEALVRALRRVTPHPRWVEWYDHTPPLRLAIDALHNVAAAWPATTDALLCLFVGSSLRPVDYALSRWIYFRMLGIVFLIAFWSLWLQWEGLIGSNGIWPAHRHLEFVAEQLGDEWYQVPSLFWLGADDFWLKSACLAGIVVSLLLIVGVNPLVALVLLWGLYLSFTTVSGPFLAFQWDVLLLETAMFSLWYAPCSLLDRPSNPRPPSRVGLWLLRWLLFRLMLMSGVVKLASDDPTWRDWTALEYHYWTQPLPTWTAYFADQLPAAWHYYCVGAMFVIELVLPFFIFGPRRFRQIACVGFVLLQLGIISSGNYGFFNLLTITLCLSLADDTWLRWLLPEALTERLANFRRPLPLRPRLWREGAAAVVAAPAVALSVIVTLTSPFLAQNGRRPPLELSDETHQRLARVRAFNSINAYGLFSRMTTQRPEIVVEGSDDGIQWHPYEFRWKPGRVDRAPQFVQPHQPRLDWQMWFAALGEVQHSPWFFSLLGHLMQNTPEVVALLEEAPFPDHPPNYLRAVKYQYRFAPPEMRHSNSVWWVREPVAFFVPPVRLEGQQLVVVQQHELPRAAWEPTP